MWLRQGQGRDVGPVTKLFTPWPLSKSQQNDSRLSGVLKISLHPLAPANFNRSKAR
jgi:hypothetical protein